MAGRRAGGNASAVGMMDGAFFVGRAELISWVNSLLQVGITKVEQCASAAIYCQILDSCHPSTVAMRKVNWMAKTDHEFIPNFKILQAAFDKNFIERHIAVDQLIRGKYQDNLEFLQWMKCYWDREGSAVGDYDPFPAREGKSLPPWAQSSGKDVPRESMKLRGGAAGGARGTPKDADELPQRKANPAPGRAAPKSAPRGPTCSTPLTGQSHAVRPGTGNRAAESADHKLVVELQEKVANQEEEIEELRDTFDGLERERDYYFRKLREVEIMCTTLKTQMESGEGLGAGVTCESLVTDIQGILYAEGDEEDDEALPAEA